MSKSGFLSRLKSKLEKTRTNLVGNVKRALGRPHIDEEVFTELEEILIGADVGVAATLQIIEDMRKAVSEKKLHDSESLLEVLKDELKALLAPGDHQIT